jgi:hypothetical protein
MFNFRGSPVDATMVVEIGPAGKLAGRALW